MATKSEMSRNCAEGNHGRCLGTYYGTAGLEQCQCDAADCPHAREPVSQ